MATPYCTSTHIQKRISQVGIDLRIDDDTGCLDEVIEEASIEVNGYCQLLYEVQDLAASDWIRLKCTDIAVYYLCMRRLNPAPKSAQERYQKAIEDLEKIQSGTTQIPDAPMSRASIPTLSNQRIQLRPFPRVVTEPARSTEMPQTGYTPHNDRQDYQFYDL